MKLNLIKKVLNMERKGTYKECLFEKKAPTCQCCCIWTVILVHYYSILLQM